MKDRNIHRYMKTHEGAPVWTVFVGLQFQLVRYFQVLITLPFAPTYLTMGPLLDDLFFGLGLHLSGLCNDCAIAFFPRCTSGMKPEVGRHGPGFGSASNGSENFRLADESYTVVACSCHGITFYNLLQLVNFDHPNKSHSFR